jgi:hypothetical protein
MPRTATPKTTHAACNATKYGTTACNAAIRLLERIMPSNGTILKYSTVGKTKCHSGLLASLPIRKTTPDLEHLAAIAKKYEENLQDLRTLNKLRRQRNLLDCITNPPPTRTLLKRIDAGPSTEYQAPKPIPNNLNF